MSSPIEALESLEAAIPPEVMDLCAKEAALASGIKLDGSMSVVVDEDGASYLVRVDGAAGGSFLDALLDAICRRDICVTTCGQEDFVFITPFRRRTYG